jgi:hypothetical protein
MEQVPSDEEPEDAASLMEGISLRRPVIAAHVLSMLAVAHRSYVEAIEAKVELFGWNEAVYGRRRLEVAKAMVDLMRAMPGVGLES